MDFVNFFLVDPPIHFCKEILNNTVPKIYELDFIKVEVTVTNKFKFSEFKRINFYFPRNHQKAIGFKPEIFWWFQGG